MDELSRAISLAATAFSGKVDKAGKPYILHLIRVMMAVPDQLKPAAVLHDIIEDCSEYSLHHLYNKGFSKRTVETIHCLTHRINESYEQYIARVSFKVDAIKIKIADLEDNMDLSRLDNPTEQDFKRNEKYLKCYNYLKTFL